MILRFEAEGPEPQPYANASGSRTLLSHAWTCKIVLHEQTAYACWDLQSDRTAAAMIG